MPRYIVRLEVATPIDHETYATSKPHAIEVATFLVEQETGCKVIKAHAQEVEDEFPDFNP